MRYILRICGISFSSNFKKLEDAGIISYISEKGDDFDYFKKLLNVTNYWGGVIFLQPCT
ncbi:hypothetical protein [Campylobacter sputorum]|uniref:hypothetical protein n=1 Tax=Campylobacter sputorum TaxID=206 RepID=UPI00137481B3|nr:hypothetical protein [Campylobacter sputorum]ASM36810.1 hypothetical protein CSF_0940 [Campylobacter sputorum bv. faecalis CCUG 20703]